MPRDENICPTQSSHWGFEGPEKVLEVEFDVPADSVLGARAIPVASWDRILELARCQILNKTSNAYFDAYVLSESSLFVYRDRVYVKTCGTTTLLRCAQMILDEASKLGLEFHWLGYSRKNYIFPENQVYPHCSFDQEISYAKKLSLSNGSEVTGSAYILGDLNSDHWYVFVVDSDEMSSDSVECNVNIMMYGLDPDVCKLFYRQVDLPSSVDAARATKESGIGELCRSATIDDCMFSPCGYSMNALDDESFYTVHVTPESGFSYASFETNVSMSDYTSLLQNVIQTFKPSRFAVTVFADQPALSKLRECPTHVKYMSVGGEKSRYLSFKRESLSSITCKDNYACKLAVYSVCESDGSTTDSQSSNSVSDDESPSK